MERALHSRSPIRRMTPLMNEANELHLPPMHSVHVLMTTPNAFRVLPL